MLFKSPPSTPGSIWLRPAWLLFCLVILPSTAQEYSAAEVKAALLVNIIKNLEFANEASQSSIDIAVWQDEQSGTSLSALNGVMIRDKRLTVSVIDSIERLADKEVVYISAGAQASLSEVAFAARGSGALIVTEESESLHNVMINIELKQQDADSSTLTFQINRPNIAYENIRISPELVLFGGSEIDIAELYYQTEKAIRALREQNQSTFEKLTEQQQSYQAIQQEYAQLQRQLRGLEQELVDKQTSIQVNESRLASLTKKVETVELQYRESQQLASQKAAELQNAEQALKDFERSVLQQKQVLARLENEIVSNNELLDTQKSQLDDAQTEVRYQSELIDKQRDLIYVVLAIVAVAILSAVAITTLFLKNKRIKDKLQSAVANLTEAKEQLVEAEKMASLGQLVTGVAHEINTPIGISLTAVSTLGAESRQFREQLQAGKLKKSEAISFAEKLEQLDELVEGNLQRCHQLVESFKLVSGDQIVEQSRNIYIGDYCHNIMATLSTFLKQQNIDWSIEGDNPEYNIDPSLLSQVISSLATNAANHAFTDQPNKAIVIHIGATESDCVLSFSDNGVGLTEEVKHHIFDPFFTTKRGAGSTGLGLNIVYTIVTNKLNGRIEVDGHPQQGTRFIISLPRYR